MITQYSLSANFDELLNVDVDGKALLSSISEGWHTLYFRAFNPKTHQVQFDRKKFYIQQPLKKVTLNL